MAVETRASVQPKSILRGHKAPVHAAAFVHANARLLTGDADGFVVAWDLTIMRPRAVWQAHSRSILGLGGWASDKIITHGRDRTLMVWRLGPDDESYLSTSLPLDQVQEPRPRPPLLHLLQVNTMNFCPFASTEIDDASSELLVAVPNILASEAIDIFHLPSQTRRHTVRFDGNSGMVMALSLLSLPAEPLRLVAGYEDGTALVAQLDAQRGWSVTYRAKSHTQPILSLDVAPTKDFFLTSSADAIIAKHPIHTKSPDPQVIDNEDDRQQKGQPKTLPDPSRSLLAAALAANNAQPPPAESPSVPPQKSSTSATPAEPCRSVNTKHAGQQSLRIRSDGRIFATAGWDAKVRVYSTKTLKEVAVLKWHQAGCCATAFSDLGWPDLGGPGTERGKPGGDTTGMAKEEPEEVGEVENNEKGITNALTTVPTLVNVKLRDKRVSQAKGAHWLAAGSKDGKVSLWHVF